jgi:small membrane protein
MPIQFLLVLILLSAVAVAWKRVRERVISAKEAVLWTLLWFIAIIIILLPNTTSIVARWLGVGRGADLVLYASIVTLFLIVFKIFVSLDALDRKLTELVRRDALRDLNRNECCKDHEAKKEQEV